MGDRFSYRMGAIALAIAVAGCADEARTGDDAVAAGDVGPTSAGDWSYTGETGPASWGTLSDDYAMCASGREQSPIDLAANPGHSASIGDLAISWGELDLSFEDTGYGIQGTPAGRPTTKLDAAELTLLQFHPHAPSEHTVAQKSFAVEVHFVHQDAEGGLAVLGVLIEEGSTNPAWEEVVSAVRSGSATGIDLAAVLPSTDRYYTYPGSLTTPPCSEGVRWIVLAEPVELGPAQIRALTGGHTGSNRPTQPLNDRQVGATM